MSPGAVASALEGQSVERAACVPLEEGGWGAEKGAGRGGGGWRCEGVKGRGLMMGKPSGTGRAEASSSPSWILQQRAEASGPTCDRAQV